MPYSGLRTLVTGGAGFVGSHLVSVLCNLGSEVTVIDNLSSGREENLPKNCVLHVADVRDTQSLVRIVAKAHPDVVFHLAAQAGVRKSLLDPLEDADVNIMGGLSVIQASLQGGTRRIVYASSGGAIYGDQVKLPCEESVVPRPVSPYGVSKLAVEHYGRQQSEGVGATFVSLRLANVYGPCKHPDTEGGVISQFLARMLAGDEVLVNGDGTQSRDFVWIGDVVDAFMKAMNGPTGVYNIGSGNETSVNELCALIATESGIRVRSRRVPTIVGEVKRSVLSVENARDVLGWSPKQELVEGVRAMIQSLRNVVVR